jgi:hypothetical protein
LSEERGWALEPLDVVVKISNLASVRDKNLIIQPTTNHYTDPVIPAYIPTKNTIIKKHKIM